MPFRLDPQVYGEFRAKVQFTTSAEMPALVFKACLATGILSNTRYYQRAVCEALSRDLGIPLDDLLAALPASRGPSGHLYDPDEHTMARHPVSGYAARTGPANTIEEVR